MMMATVDSWIYLILKSSIRYESMTYTVRMATKIEATIEKSIIYFSAS
jgi:hypothetical protein